NEVRRTHLLADVADNAEAEEDADALSLVGVAEDDRLELRQAVADLGKQPVEIHPHQADVEQQDVRAEPLKRTDQLTAVAHLACEVEPLLLRNERRDARLHQRLANRHQDTYPRQSSPLSIRSPAGGGLLGRAPHTTTGSLPVKAVMGNPSS